MLAGVAAVVNPGQRIDHGHHQTVAHVRAQAIGIALAAHLAADPRDQLVHVEGHFDIVRRAQVETLGGGLHIALVDDQDDRRGPRFGTRAQRRDEPQAVTTFHQVLVHDEDIRNLQPREIHRLAFGSGGDDRNAEPRAQAFGPVAALPDRWRREKDRAAGFEVDLLLAHVIGEAKLARGEVAQAQFVEHHLHAHEIAHAREEREIVEGFRQEIIRARLEAANPLLPACRVR